MRWGMMSAMLVALCGCAGLVPPGAGAQEPAKGLAAVTAEDLDQAAAMATKAGAAYRATCYQTLKKYLAPAGGLQLPAVKGAFSLFELGLEGTEKVHAGVPQDLHVACAPVVVDGQNVLIRLGVIGAGAVLK